VEKYMISEEMSSKEKISYIVKKGFTIQKMAVLKIINF
jgi:hypothetical protein